VPDAQNRLPIGWGTKYRSYDERCRQWLLRPNKERAACPLPRFEQPPVITYLPIEGLCSRFILDGLSLFWSNGHAYIGKREIERFRPRKGFWYKEAFGTFYIGQTVQEALTWFETQSFGIINFILGMLAYNDFRRQIQKFLQEIGETE
jgi:hypothetical protein